MGHKEQCLGNLHSLHPLLLPPKHPRHRLPRMQTKKENREKLLLTRRKCLMPKHCFKKACVR